MEQRITLLTMITTFLEKYQILRDLLKSEKYNWVEKNAAGLIFEIFLNTNEGRLVQNNVF